MNQQESIEFAKKYIEDIVSFFGENVEVDVEYDDEVIHLLIQSSSLNSILIGRNAETLRSLQYLVSTALRHHDADIQRVNVDVADYKKQRAEKIADKARGWMEQVIETGESYIARINAADRRIVHKVAEEFDDIVTHSEGEGRDRRLIIEKR